MINPAGPTEAAAPSSLAHAGRGLLNGAIFLAVCALGCAVIGWLRPLPEVKGLYPKWTYFRENLDRFDTIFIGSSRFYHQIIPHQFDAAVAAAGLKTKSFNFAYDAVWPPESYYFLRRILALHPPRLKWVVIELMDIDVRLDPRTTSLRMAYWHDLRHTALVLRDIAGSRRSKQKKFDLMAEHAVLAFQQLINLGHGSDLLQNRLAPRQRKKAVEWAGAEGFEAGPDRGVEGKLLQELETGVAKMRKALPPQPVRPVFREALAEIIAEVRQAGAEPIFVIAPTINSDENFTEIPGGVAVFPFLDPKVYPDLFNPEHRYDSWHLNGRGAVEFTRHLAEKFIEVQKAQP